MNEVTQPINRSRRLARGALAVLVGTALWFHQPLLAWFSGRPLSIARHDAPVDRSRSKAIDHYTCSMHPSVHQSAPGTCPICGMNLVPVTEEQQREGIVTIEPARQQLIGVRTAEVIEAPMVRSIRAIGRVEYDESKLTEISSRVHGWIERLLVNQTGEPVQKGQTLFTLYSPELYSAQQDLLLATRASSMSEASAPHHGRDLASAARQRLHLLDLADDQIEAVIQRGEPLASVAIASRATGFVIEKNVVEGGSIEPGMRLYRIAPLDPIWIAVDVYAADMAEVRAGQRATVTLDALPGRNYEARVAYVYPAVESATRTGQVRLELANRSMELRPGMYASVELRSEVASKIQVPVSAVVYTGRRRLVFVDLGGGHFRAREIELGFESDGMYEVRA
jgi:Cu(I)/Ag(I) efflux system membrane fusion protein